VNAGIGFVDIWAFGAVITFTHIMNMLHLIRQSRQRDILKNYDNWSAAVKVFVISMLCMAWPITWVWYLKPRK